MVIQGAGGIYGTGEIITHPDKIKTTIALTNIKSIKEWNFGHIDSLP